MERIIFHVDVNSAFLSWEATRRVANGEPDLREVPSIIGGDPEKRTSIVTAKSIPAKKFGIVTGEPVSAALRKCPNLVIARSDFALYSKCSRAFKNICREYTPVVEEFSIDECFLDMTTMRRLHPDPIRTAHELKDRIKDELGFTVNIGVAHNKLLAKMASDFQKPDRVHTLFEDEIAEKMWPLDVGELFLCGKASVEKLKRLQINTIGDLAKADEDTIRTILGNKLGEQLWKFANGIDYSEVNPEPEAPKGYGNEITFDDNITTWEQGENVLLHLADNVAARVRRDDVKGFCVSVTIRGNDMKKHSHQHKLQSATDSTTRIYEVAKALYRELWDGMTPLRLIGLSLSEMDRDGEEQLSLFGDEAGGAMAGEAPDSEKDRNADKAVDVLRERFGSDIIKRGGMINSGITPRKK
ncbi:MAG: DNA polymerase IV [Clostridia bacterium]|nr:DNA polymerase IV [Clostridia bacterium]